MSAYAPNDTRPLEPDRSLGELFGDLSREFTALMNDHIELAKLEVRDEATNAVRAAGLFGAAGVTGLFALLLLSFAAAWGLAVVMPTGFAFLIVGAIWAVAAVVLAMVGRARAAQVGPPDETIETVKEDVAWVRQIRS
jgi:uncharacterized membrane protein YqjE